MSKVFPSVFVNIFATVFRRHPTWIDLLSTSQVALPVKISLQAHFIYIGGSLLYRLVINGVYTIVKELQVA